MAERRRTPLRARPVAEPYVSHARPLARAPSGAVAHRVSTDAATLGIEETTTSRGSVGVTWREVIAWHSVESIALDRSTPVHVHVRCRGRPDVRVRLHGHGDPLFLALRAHAPPGVYRLSQTDEVLAMGGRAPTPVSRGWVEPSEQTSHLADDYRSASRPAPVPLGRADLTRPFPNERTSTLAMTLAGGVMVAGGASAVSPALGFVTLLGTGVLAGAQLWAAARSASIEVGPLRERARALLGPSPTLDPLGMLVSRDGTRRLRQLPDDLGDPHAGPHVHLETIDPSTGKTLTSSAEMCPDLGLPAAMARPTRRLLAAVIVAKETTPLRASSTSDAPDLALAERTLTVVCDVGRDGTILRRLGVSELHLGDTFHPSLDAARAQAAEEFEHTSFLEAPLDEPWGLLARAEASDAR